MMRAKDQNSRLSIPHDAMIFVGDGQKALFLRNKQGTDRPGRVFKRAATNRRSGVAATDWHEIEKHHFARRVAAAMEKLVRAKEVKTVIVVAPPRTLADLRQAFHADVRSKIVAEIGKDLTKHSTADIEKHLFE